MRTKVLEVIKITTGLAIFLGMMLITGYGV